MKFELYLAYRHLKTKKDNLFISKLLSISILTVTLAIMVPIIVLSVINGFHNTIQEKIIGNNFQLRISHRYDNFDSYKEILKQLNPKINSNVELAIPFFEKQGLIKLKSGKTIFSVIVKAFRNEDIYQFDKKGKLKRDELGNPIPINKLFVKNFRILHDWDYQEENDLDYDDKITNLSVKKNNIKINKLFLLRKVDDIIIGDALRKYIHVYRGMGIKLLIPQGDIQLDTDSSNLKTLRVSKIYTAEYRNFDKKLIFINFNAIKDIFHFKAIPTDIGVNLKKGVSSKDFISLIEKNHPDLVVTNTLEEGLFKDFAQEKSLMIILLLFLVLSAFITIYIAVHVVVMDKRKEIGLLKTIGSKKKNIQLIFVVEGLLISVTGVIFGNLLGILITTSLNEIVSFIEYLVNSSREFVCASNMGELFNMVCPSDMNNIAASWYWHIMNRTTFYLKEFPYVINYSDIILLSVGAIFVSIFAAYFPSKKASDERVVDSFKV